MKLGTSQITAFLALAETLHFATAADRCHVSTSAFSQIIGRMEDEFGTRLFDRSTRHVELTPEGQVFAEGAKRIAAEIEALDRSMKQSVSGRTGRVRIAATPTPCVSLIPRIMRVFRDQYPDVELSLKDAVSDRCLKFLLDGDVDLVVAAQAGDPELYESQALFHEPFHVVCLKTSPLARRKRVRLEELRGQPFLKVIGMGHVWEQRQRELEAVGVEDTGFEVANFGTLMGLIKAGFGIGLVTRMSLPLCQGEELTSRPIVDRDFLRTFYITRRRGRSLSTCAENMATLIAKTARE